MDLSSELLGSPLILCLGTLQTAIRLATLSETFLSSRNEKNLLNKSASVSSL